MGRSETKQQLQDGGPPSQVRPAGSGRKGAMKGNRTERQARLSHDAFTAGKVGIHCGESPLPLSSPYQNMQEGASWTSTPGLSSTSRTHSPVWEGKMEGAILGHVEVPEGRHARDPGLLQRLPHADLLLKGCRPASPVPAAAGPIWLWVPAASGTQNEEEEPPGHRGSGCKGKRGQATGLKRPGDTGPCMRTMLLFRALRRSPGPLA